MLSELSHRQADRRQFPHRNKSQLPQGVRLGRPILLRSAALLSPDNSKHHDTFAVGLHDITLYPACIHPLIGVLFAPTIPDTTCPGLSPFFSFTRSLLCVSSLLAVSLQHVTVCVSCLSPEVYLSYLWGWVTMVNPVFRWLFSTLRGELAEPEVSSCYRAP